MKTSPLQLKWIVYPQASYEACSEFNGDDEAPVLVDVAAEVRYSVSGEHTAFLQVENKVDDSNLAYKFKVSAVAGFQIDLEIAKAAYKPKMAKALPPIVAVNVARILYSSVREQLAMMTSRGPFSSVSITSVLLEVSDVHISSPGATPYEILKDVFGATDDELIGIPGPETVKKKVSRKK